MKKSDNQGKELIAGLKDIKKQKRQERVANSSFVCAVKGLWMFAEGAALVITSLFSIHQGYYSNFPDWGRDILIVSGVLVLVPAAILLSKFFRSVGRS